MIFGGLNIDMTTGYDHWILSTDKIKHFLDCMDIWVKLKASPGHCLVWNVAPGMRFQQVHSI